MTPRAADAGAARELLGRFAADREAIIAILLGAVDPGPITGIDAGLGHPYQGGRSVTRLSFADGRKLIYRPRSVAAPQWFGGALDWLNERVPQARLRHATVLARPGYGWVEFVDHQPPASLASLDQFYRNCGMLLAVLYALDAVGLEAETLMASEDCPVPVNVEALFHPSLATPADTADPAALLLAASVHRTGLLQAIGAPGRRGDRRPTDEPAASEMAVIAGFRLGYDAIAAQRDGFARLVHSAGDLDVRFIPRPKSEYRRLLADSTAPGPPRHAGEREGALSAAGGPPEIHPEWRRLVPHELADLRIGDFPLLTSRPAAREVWTSAGVELSEVLSQPGMDPVLKKVASLNEVDRRDQEWIISATLAALRSHTGLPATAPPPPLTSIAASRARLLAAACGLADQIVSRSIASESLPHPGSVNWLGLRVGAHVGWEVRPMGPDLANGYLGVGLYLAQLASLTGIGRYAEIARQALCAAPSLLRTLDGQHELAATGCGGYNGLSGISYGLARMATLLDDPQLSEWATAAVGLTAAAAGSTANPGWADGTAGCLAAMTAVWRETGSPDAESLARTMAGRLAELVDQTEGWCTPNGERPQAGFARGPGGVGWALARFAAIAGEEAYLHAGTRAVRRAVDLAEATPALEGGWCHGTAGLLVARCCLTDEASPVRLELDLLALSKRPVLRDLSLCQGELGITEALIVVPPTGRVGLSPQLLRRRAGLLLDALHRQARYCGTPGGVSTPGLLHGLAGIGYGLLRLGFPDRVPAVLLLEPSPSTSTTQPISTKPIGYNARRGSQ
jgi:lantibiotic modifying enzyme